MASHNYTFSLDLSLLRLKDHNVYNYPLMPSLWQLIAIMSFYTMFIYKLGPNLMKNRNPFSLKTIMVVYNLVQIILNAIVFYMTAKLIPHFHFCCSPINSSDNQEDIAIQKVHYFYLVLKFLDLFDTIVFVLRKKYNQVSFLHMHHHIGMTITTWATLKYVPGGPLCYVFVWNTFIHCVMYTYYLLTSMEAFKSLWWKKYLTQLQMVQHSFVVVVLLTNFLNINCSYPKKLLAFYLFNTVLSLGLFAKFYIKNYIQHKNKCK